MISNYHTHSRYCDGKGEPREYVEYAIAHGFSALGFSGHGPLPYRNRFSIKQDDYLSYCNEIRALQAEYDGKLEIKLGLEIDYIPGIQEDFHPLVEKGGLDYSIGSVHLVTPPDKEETLRDTINRPDNAYFKATDWLWYIDGGDPTPYDEGLKKHFNGDIHNAVKAFFFQNNAMIERNSPTIVGHIDKVVMHNRGRYFDMADHWFKDLLYETLQLIKEYECICEINTRGLYKGRHTDYYPSKETIIYMNSLNIPVMVGTDAHQPTDLTQFMGANEFLKEVGYKNIVSRL